MNNFLVDNLTLSAENITENVMTIKSIPNNYNVFFKKFDTSFSDSDFVLVDSNVQRIYSINHKNLMPIEATENNKNIETALQVCEWLVNNNFNKGNVLYVIGGGITQDIGAFVGSMYKRGIRWIYVPTTLLSQCDSCIGGKTGLNFNGMKNQLALFSAPNEIIIDNSFLSSLPQKEITSGLGEIIKFFIMGGEYYISQLEKELEVQIRYGLSIKKAVVENDEFEKNIRKSLNYGHSFGHAIESIMDYSISHGEAVLLGIEIINQLFTKSKIITNIINKHTSLEKIKNINTRELLQKLKHDKKSQLDTITLVIAEPGKTWFNTVKIDEDLEKRLDEIFIN
jgi:3-dehydroquinate synthase